MTGINFWEIAGLLAAFVSLPGAITIAMLRGLRGDIMRTQDQLTSCRAQERVELKNLSDRVAEVEQTKVGQHDWAKVVTSQLNRMNRLSEQLCEMAGKLDATLGVGAAVTRVATALERQRKDGDE